MAEKRAKKAAEEAKEHQANEALRRKAGKVYRFLLQSWKFIYIVQRPVKGHEQDQGRTEDEASATRGRSQETRL